MKIFHLIFLIHTSLQAGLKELFVNFAKSTLVPEKFTKLYEENSVCKSFVSLMFNSPYKIASLYFNSDKYGRSGEYEQCLNDNNLYVVINYYYTQKDTANFSPSCNIGLCVFKACSDLFKEIFDVGNDRLFNYIFDNTNYVVLFVNFTFVTKNDKYLKESNLILRVFFLLILMYVTFRFSIPLMKKLKVDWITNMTLRKAFSLTKNFKNLLTVKNVIYNDTHLDRFTNIYLLSIYGINYYFLVLSSWANSLNSNMLLLAPKFQILFKLASHSVSLFMIVRGLFFCFKLLSFLRKNNSTDFKTFFKFYMKTIPQMLINYIIILFFNYFFYDLFLIILDKVAINNPYNKLFLQQKKCQMSTWKFFVPFYMNYFSTADCNYYPYKHPCNVDFEIISTEYYLFTLSLVAIYLLIKFKNKCLEWLFCLLPIITLVFPLFDFDFTNNDPSNAILFSQNFIFKPHYLVFPYLCGVILGTIYFYDNNLSLFTMRTSINEQDVDINKIYYPMKFLIYVNIYFHRRSNIIITIICILSLVLILLNSSSISIILLEDYFKGFKPWLEIFNKFGHHIFAVLASIYILMTIYKEVIPSDFFLMITRNSQTIILSSFFIGNLVYFLNENIYKKRLSNTTMELIFGLSGFSLNVIAAIMFNILVEMPLKVVLHKYLKGN